MSYENYPNEWFSDEEEFFARLNYEEYLKEEEKGSN